MLTRPRCATSSTRSCRRRCRERFENKLELDTSHVVPGVGPLPPERVPAARFGRRGLPRHPLRDHVVGGARRAASVRQFADLPRGLVLVTGPTGSGKSTTLASLIDIINSTSPAHHVGRGPDRVPAPPQDGRRQPARSRGGHEGFRRGLETRFAPGPRRDPRSAKSATSRRYRRP